MPDQDLLTDEELELLDLAKKMAGLLSKIIGRGDTRAIDIAEAYGALHVIQRMVGAQAAARAYPDACRLLGD